MYCRLPLPIRAQLQQAQSLQRPHRIHCTSESQYFCSQYRQGVSSCCGLLELGLHFFFVSAFFCFLVFLVSIGLQSFEISIAFFRFDSPSIFALYGLLVTTAACATVLDFFLAARLHGVLSMVSFSMSENVFCAASPTGWAGVSEAVDVQSAQKTFSEILNDTIDKTPLSVVEQDATGTTEWIGWATVWHSLALKVETSQQCLLPYAVLIWC